MRETPGSPVAATKGFRLQRHVDALYTLSKHFPADSKKTAQISTGISVEYAIHTKEMPGATKDEHVVMIMGFSGPKEAWAQTVDQLLQHWPAAGRNKNLRILTLDNRGAGQSTAYWGRYTTSQMAEDVVALLDHLGWKNAHIVGVSMGGMISLELAANFPKRVKSLSLLVTTRGNYVNDKGNGNIIRMLLSRDADTMAELVVGILYPEAFTAQKMADSNETIYTKLFTYHRDQINNAPPSSLSSRISSLSGWVGQGLAVKTHYVSDERLAAIGQAGFPVLIIGCREDNLIPGRESEILAAHIKGSHVKHILYEDAGHGFYVQYMDEFTQELISTFMRGSL
ncbi:hypothetical protein Poli38472_000747 [Pythium oligandrum]|uniref:AB hydrolase-1 domain-containing protein n=1 Tax=Pythium oligandrum TaxID=41045 RepID=A0A8K1FEM5_PYTOL|nr:hypothetical protein Poli38472_000747 [Pythium oligandrum]|eukprot:TMW60705.1 hypothetical protein Poli38472_000747 [Pythium oligandrum]